MSRPRLHTDPQLQLSSSLDISLPGSSDFEDDLEVSSEGEATDGSCLHDPDLQFDVHKLRSGDRGRVAQQYLPCAQEDGEYDRHHEFEHSSRMAVFSEHSKVAFVARE